MNPWFVKRENVRGCECEGDEEGTNPEESCVARSEKGKPARFLKVCKQERVVSRFKNNREMSSLYRCNGCNAQRAYFDGILQIDSDFRVKDDGGSRQRNRDSGS